MFLLEQSFQVTEGEIILADGTTQENAIVTDSIRNVTICKEVYKNMYGAVADCLCKAFNYMDKEQLKNRKRFTVNFFFIDFDYKNIALELY